MLNPSYKKILLVFLVAPFLMSAKHIGPSYDTRPREALDVLGKNLAKKHGLQFLNSGLGHLADAKQGLWALNFVSRQKLTLEKARALAADLTYALLYKMYHDPLYANYCKLSATENKSPDIKDEYAAFRLAFWDENTNRPLYPYVAQVRLADGKLYYHYADPNSQALQEPIVVESVKSLEIPDYQKN